MAKAQIMTDLSVRISTQTAELNKGLAKASSKVKGFTSKTKAAGASMSNAFSGVAKNLTGGIMTGLSGALAGISSMARVIYAQVIPAIGAMGTALTVATGGIILLVGLVIGAVSSIFVWINRTVEGTQKWKVVTSFIGGIWDAILDRISAVGRFMFDIVTFSGEAFKNLKKNRSEMNGLFESARMAADLQRQENQLWKDKQKILLKIAKLDEQISATRLIANDITKGTKVQLKAINLAQKQTIERGKLAIDLVTRERDIAIARSKIAKNDMATEEAITQFKINVVNAEAARNRELKALLLRKNSLVNLNNKELKQLEAINKLERERASIPLKKKGLPDSGLKGVAIPKLIPKVEVEKGGSGAFEQDTLSFNNYLGIVLSGLQTISDFRRAAMNRELAAAGDNEKKKEQIRKKFARKQKQEAILMAIINGALGITKAFAQTGVLGFITGALIAAATAAQIAIISSQPLAVGGVVGQGNSGFSLTTVGERGKEALAIPNGSRVISHADTMKAITASNSRGMGGHFTIDNIVIEGEDLRIALKEAERKFTNTA